MGNYKISDFETMSLFKNVNATTIEKLSKINHIKYFKKNDYLFKDKDKVNNIYIVVYGKVELYKLSESSQKKVIFILSDNSIINAVVIDDLPSSINCQCFEDAKILCFNKNEFINIMKEDFELTKEVIKSLSIKVRKLYRQSKNSIAIKIEKKLAMKLWKLSKDYGVQVEEGTLINMNLTVTYLGEMLGTSRETISRAMKYLDNNNYIINKNKKIIILDRDRLANFFKEIKY